MSQIIKHYLSNCKDDGITTVRLEKYDTHSIIILLEGKAWKDVIRYTHNAHKELSEINYKSLKTQLATYGSDALIDLFNYFKARTMRSS